MGLSITKTYKESILGWKNTLETEAKKDYFKTREELYYLISKDSLFDKFEKDPIINPLAKFLRKLGNPWLLDRYVSLFLKWLSKPWMVWQKVEFLNAFYKWWDYYLATRENNSLLLYKLGDSIIPYYIIKEKWSKLPFNPKYCLSPLDQAQVVIEVDDLNKEGYSILWEIINKIWAPIMLEKDYLSLSKPVKE